MSEQAQELQQLLKKMPSIDREHKALLWFLASSGKLEPDIIEFVKHHNVDRKSLGAQQAFLQKAFDTIPNLTEDLQALLVFLSEYNSLTQECITLLKDRQSKKRFIDLLITIFSCKDNITKIILDGNESWSWSEALAYTQIFLQLLSVCSKLEHIELTTSVLSLGQSFPQLATILSGLKQLKFFSITALNSLSDTGLKHVLGGLSSCENLRQLHILSECIKHDGVICLAEALPSFPNLQVLAFIGNQITDDSIKILVPALAQCLLLQVLNISGNRLTSLSLPLLAEFLPKLRFLECLYMVNNNIENSGMQALIDILSRCNLERITISNDYFDKSSMLKLVNCFPLLPKLRGIDCISRVREDNIDDFFTTLLEMLPKTRIISLNVKAFGERYSKQNALEKILQFNRRRERSELALIVCSGRKRSILPRIPPELWEYIHDEYVTKFGFFANSGPSIGSEPEALGNTI